ncbi:MAG: hypothetical protein AAF726_25465, partial [Planctomycetota bacterium]
IEQTFVFDELPGSGDLVLTIDVETDLDAVDGDVISFAHPTRGEVRYGRAFAYDAEGRRIEIERTLDGRSIRLVVPADFVAGATLPLTVDPPISTFTSTPTTVRAKSPDITYCGSAQRYFVCWEEETSSTNSDVFVTSFDRAGNGGGIAVAESGNASWTTPRIAYSAASDRLLVVADASVVVVFPDNAIAGRLFDPSTLTAVGASFPIASSGFDPVRDPDVGGSSSPISSGGQFLVAWSQLVDFNTWALRVRVLSGSGSPITGVQDVANSLFEQAIQPAVSESEGGPSAFGDFWSLVWIRDINDDGLGQVRGRRIARSGNLSIGSSNTLIEPLQDCRRPSVTSRLDQPLLGDRPSIVAYERKPDAPAFPNSGVYARVFIDGTAYSSNAISNTRQDLPNPLLDQEAPSIAADGEGFLLTYVERGTSRDTYVVSGNITVVSGDVAIALAERGAAMSSSPGEDVQCRVATVRDGDASSILDDGACVWVERVPGDDKGRVRGMTLDIATTIDPAVGVQYCDANRNVTGTSSWMWIRGTQSRFLPHEAICVDVPPNSFGYLLCSRSLGNANMPGGSAGRLCLSGDIGRFLGQIGSSGPSGVLRADISPLALPQPNGTVSAGFSESWYFQFWHRDSMSGAPTSNFSNGCMVNFL